MPRIAKILHWLWSEKLVSEDGRYRHQLLREEPGGLVEVLDALRAYVDHAHADALRNYRRLIGISLNPLRDSPDDDPTTPYPRRLHISVLTSYFGEILAGIVAEHYAPLGEGDWEVPAYLFRFHTVAFQALEASLQTRDPPGRLVGRTGNDCLAFRRDGRGQIVKCLHCEAKCCARHDAHLIAAAHEQAGGASIVDIPQLIEILEDRGDPVSASWIEPLRQLRLRLEITEPACERCDLVCYVCGQSPKQLGRSVWMPTAGPHPQYAGGRRLEAVEVHLQDVERVVRLAYRLDVEP
jgi:hypothetical protein